MAQTSCPHFVDDVAYFYISRHDVEYFYISRHDVALSYLFFCHRTGFLMFRKDAMNMTTVSAIRCIDYRVKFREIHNLKG